MSGKIAAERNHKALLELAMKPGNGEHRFHYTPHARTAHALPLDHPVSRRDAK